MLNDRVLFAGYWLLVKEEQPWPSCCCAAPSFVHLCTPAVQVQDAAAVAGSAAYRTVGNRDIEHLLDELLHCVARPADVPDVVTALSATTFVQVGGLCLSGSCEDVCPRCAMGLVSW